MLTILPLSRENRDQLNQADARFLAGDRVQLRVTRKGFTPEYTPLPNAEWRTVQPLPVDADHWLADPKAACFLAFVDGQHAGQAIVRLMGHRLCELLDLRTDTHFRRQGVGTELINACQTWAESMRRVGIRVETTDEQPVACQFFESYGFTLGGVDRLLHSADPDQARRFPAMRESVLVFYKFFRQ